MAHRIVKEVTSPVHGPGGVVLHSPGEQFGLDHDLGSDALWRLVIAEVPDPPVKQDVPVKPAVKPAVADEPAVHEAKPAVKAPVGKH